MAESGKCRDMSAAVESLAQELGALCDQEASAAGLARLEELEAWRADLARVLSAVCARGRLALGLLHQKHQSAASMVAEHTTTVADLLQARRLASLAELEERLPGILRPLAWNAALALGRVEVALRHLEALLRIAPSEARAQEALCAIERERPGLAPMVGALRDRYALVQKAVLPLPGATYLSDMACSPAGTLFVTDPQANAIRLHAQDGTLLRLLDEGLYAPYGVTALDEPYEGANIMCCDQGNMRLLLLDDAGELRAQINVHDLLGFGELALYPTTVCCCAGRVVVAARSGDDRDHLFSFALADPQGTLFRFSPAQTRQVTGLCAAEGRLHVVSASSACADVYAWDHDRPVFERRVPLPPLPVKLVSGAGAFFLVTHDRIAKYSSKLELVYSTALPTRAHPAPDCAFARIATGRLGGHNALFILDDAVKSIHAFTI